MKSEANTIESFKTKYPNLFKDDSPRCGFWVGDGWLPLVDRLCSLIEFDIQNNIPEDIRGDFFVTQIKEKFGSLRVYLNKETPFISGLIAMAEGMSSLICETCGNPGKKRNNDYIQTLCDSCEKKRNKKK